MTDRELLELAAKAAMVEPLDDEFGETWRVYYTDPSNGLKRYTRWNPLTDDGDALRLAVKLNLLVDCQSQCARPLPDSIEWQEGSGPDDYANTRRAIVRAAAEIGRAMP